MSDLRTGSFLFIFLRLRDFFYWYEHLMGKKKTFPGFPNFAQIIMKSFLYVFEPYTKTNITQKVDHL
jgi:hypothetical protein